MGRGAADAGDDAALGDYVCEVSACGEEGCFHEQGILDRS